MRKNPLIKSSIFLITGFLFIFFTVPAIAAPPRADFNSSSNNYLVVYDKSTAVYGQVVDGIGNPVGSEIPISTAMISGAPSVSYNSNTNQYLVVWHDFRNYNYDVYGQLINANGTLSGNNIEISTATSAQYFPSVVYNVNTNQYLVVWMDARGGTDWDIYGQLINADGTLAGINFSISTAPNNQSNPAVAYNSTANQYLIVWHDNRDGNYDIYGQIVEADGGLSGTNFAITTGINTSSYPSITYNSLTNQYLIVWHDNRDGNYDIYGQIVEADGGLSGTNFAITTGINTSSYPSITYNSFTNQYLVVWQEYLSEYTIRGQFLTSTGVLTGTDFLISNADSPYGVANTIKGNYLVAFKLSEGYSWEIAGKVLTVDKSGSGTGTVISNDGGINCEGDCAEAYAPDTNVILTASEDASSIFSGWSGDCADIGSNQALVTMDMDKTCVAHFSKIYTLSITKVGKGTVYSNEGGISCGSDCNEPYPDGTLVILTATPDADSVFMGWSGTCISTCGKNAKVIMDADRTCTATFITLSDIQGITLITPNGNQDLPSGSTCDIEWIAPTNAHHYTLKLSMDNGMTWSTIASNVTGNSHNWDVPIPWNNKRKCFIKVIAFNASNVKIGSDRSDGPFTIEVVKLNSPNGGETLTSGTSYTITWTTNSTKKPVSKVILSYTKDGGMTWKVIDTLTSNDYTYEWTVPLVLSPKTKCKIKVVLKDSAGNTIGSDVSDGFFTIQP